MGFRDPVQTIAGGPATSLDTTAGAPLTAGVHIDGSTVSWSDVHGNPPATATDHVDYGTGGSTVTYYDRKWRLTAGTIPARTTDPAWIELATEQLAGGPLRTHATLHADAITLDDAGATLNANSYGAVGDGVTDSTTALQAALDACPQGGEVFLPMGTFIITAPLLLKRNRTLRGVHAGRWTYDTGSPSCIRAGASFTGDALVLMQDEEALFGTVGANAPGLQAGPNDQCGMRLTRLTLDGGTAANPMIAGTMDGILARGLVRDVRLNEVTVRRVFGTGFHTVGYTRSNGTTVYPRGWSGAQLVADSCGNNGFAFNLLDDSIFIDALAVAAYNNGFYIAGAGEFQLIASRSVFNKHGHGVLVTGGCYGNVVLQISTDRNQFDGIHIDATGNATISLVSPALRRDGANNNAGGGSFAGLCVSGSTCLVVVTGITTQPGVDDAGAGALSPQYGARVLNSRSVVIVGGVLWGATGTYSNGGGNTDFRVSNVVQGTGSTTSPTYTYSP